MKVTKQLQVRSITHYAFELDPQIKIQPEQLKTIVDTIIQYGNPPRVSIISILGDDDGSFSLDFDSFDKLYAYVKTHNMWDADTFVLQHEYYSDILNFGFSLWTNRMNVGFSNFEPEEVLRLVERIEAVLLGNSAEVPPVTSIPEPVIPQPQPQKKTLTCPKCGKAVHEDHLFCCHCGADLRIPLCRFCNKELPENAVFCPWCGKTLADQ